MCLSVCLCTVDNITEMPNATDSKFGKHATTKFHSRNVVKKIQLIQQKSPVATPVIKPSTEQMVEKLVM